EMDMVLLSQLLKSPESVDAVSLFPLTIQGSNKIRIDKKYLSVLLQTFRWSEKVKASGILAHKFENQDFDQEQMRDLWILRGNKEKAKTAFIWAVNSYKKEQLHPLVKRVGEKILKLDILSQVEEIELLQNLLVSYECCGELSQVIQTRKKLIEKPEIKNQANLLAPVLRALAIDYSKQGNWSLFKELRSESASMFRENRSFTESSGEFMALSLRAIDELNIIKGLELSDEALHDAQLAGHVESICKSMAIKSYLLAMDGKYESGHKMAQ